jgi:hypothetical protein
MAGLEETEIATPLDLWSLQNFAVRTKSHSTLSSGVGSMQLQFLH